MVGSRRAWILLVLLVIGGPATAGVVDVPRVMVAGDHIGNAFLQRPETRIWVQTSSGLKRMTGIQPRRATDDTRSSLPSLPPSSLLCLGAALLVSGNMIRRRVMRPRTS
jgi:hypothetical protein